MKLWINVWRGAWPTAAVPYETTVHASERDAIESVADEMAEDSFAYVGTIRVYGSTRDCVSWVDLSEEAEEELRERAEEEAAQAAEERMLRWRQSGL